MYKILLLCGALTLTLQAQTVTVTATPSSVSFTYQSGAALPSAQTVAVKAGSGTQGFVTAVTGTNSLWLTVSPDSGKLPELEPARQPHQPCGGQLHCCRYGNRGRRDHAAEHPVTLVVTSPPPTLTLSDTGFDARPAAA